MIKRFIGVTIAVKDLNAAVKKYEGILGVKAQYMEAKDFAIPGMKGAFLRAFDVQITLLTSEQPDTSITKFLETRGEGVFLIGFEVDDAEKARKELQEKGVQFVGDKPVSFSGGKVNFAHPKSMNGLQVEFAQINEDHKFKH